VPVRVFVTSAFRSIVLASSVTVPPNVVVPLTVIRSAASVPVSIVRLVLP